MNRLDKIEARANAATEGPWEVKPYNGWHDASDEIDSFVGPSDATIVEQLGCGCCDVGLEVSPTDAEFIAHARTDVPWLLEQVDRRDKALEKVLRLHPRVVVLHADPEFGRMEDDAICGACIVNHEPANWPCPTVTAIRRHLGDEQ